MATPLPWSFSALNGFTQCPHRHLEVKVLKNFKDESGEAAQWGIYVHKCIEDAVNLGVALPSEIHADAPARDAFTLPDNVRQYAGQIWSTIGGGLKYVKAEHRLAINTRFEPVPWEQRWCGSISDILKVRDSSALVIDWKLGKVKPTDQLKLNALMVFHNYPEVDEVEVVFVWLQFGTEKRETYYRDQIPELWNTFIPDLRQYAQAFKNDVWQCRPSGLCRGWCPVETCQHWRCKK